VDRERSVLEAAGNAVTERAPKADQVVDGTPPPAGGRTRSRSGPKVLRQELLGVESELKRKLEGSVLDCWDRGRTVHYVAAST
jgi:hypothetical protein